MRHEPGGAAVAGPPPGAGSDADRGGKTMIGRGMNWRRVVLVAAFVVPFVAAAPAAAQDDEEATFPETLVTRFTELRTTIITNLTERFGLPTDE